MGAPPHGGFAMGIERFVALMAGEPDIRQVIAFPKVSSGSDPLTGAPTPMPRGGPARARDQAPCRKQTSRIADSRRLAEDERILRGRSPGMSTQEPGNASQRRTADLAAAPRGPAA